MVEDMTATGIRRKVDDLGRIVIPASMRKTLGIEVGDELEFALDGDQLRLTKPADRCAFCDEPEHLEAFHGKAVCWSCMAAIRALDRERARPPFA
jgi:AbrB family transcriptional regulator, transcriptional pleiotropic regulator of transition state genes